VVNVPADAQLDWYRDLSEALLRTTPIHTGEVHAQDTSDNPQAATYELLDVRVMCDVPDNLEEWRHDMKPNLPWADDHFEERVSGIPMNPAPSHRTWPFARANNAEHTDANHRFSHTYPERFWPRHAGQEGYAQPGAPNFGIRYQYGDLTDVVGILHRNPLSRQAYLPVWFPEDLTAGRAGQRVPCTIGYHFMIRDDRVHCWYTMRSCDFVRYLRDDLYMAGRLMMWVAEELNTKLDAVPGRMGEYGKYNPGALRLTISNLHAFAGDRWLLRKLVDER
jgi:hypothetical protein